MQEPQNAIEAGVKFRGKNIKADFYENTDDWLRKISALSNTIGCLAVHDGNEEIMRLADIIGDYSAAIGREMSEREDILERIDDTILSPLARAEEVLNFVSLNPINNASDLDPVIHQIQILNKFIEQYAKPAIEIKNKFDHISIKYLNKVKMK